MYKKQTVSSSLMTISLILISIAFYLEGVISQNSHFQKLLAVLSVVALVIAFSLRMGPIPWIIRSEIFPPDIKGLAGSVATLLNWTMSWVVTMTANLLVWSAGGTFMIYGIMSAFAVVFTTFLIPETKGKTLEEIQLSFG